MFYFQQDDRYEQHNRSISKYGSQRDLEQLQQQQQLQHPSDRDHDAAIRVSRICNNNKKKFYCFHDLFCTMITIEFLSVSRSLTI